MQPMRIDTPVAGLGAVLGAVLVACLVVASGSSAQTVPTPDTTTTEDVVAIAAPRFPIPPEAESAEVTRFSFLVYGDTRGRRDGVNPQYEHSLIVESMLRRIDMLRVGPDPVRFVLQSGDAVVNGRDPRQWNVSFVGLINRLTQEGGVPYFLAPGNHDVTGSGDV
jgi:3',5'-cyclic AMP phosphodiesterase CpdA